MKLAHLVDLGNNIFRLVDVKLELGGGHWFMDLQITDPDEADRFRAEIARNGHSIYRVVSQIDGQIVIQPYSDIGDLN